LPGSGRGAGAV